MPERVRFIANWLIVVFWMSIIFTASTDVMAERRTSRFIVPALHWLFPGISDSAVERVQYTIRKGGHVTEYAILALLLWRALRQPRQEDPRPWSWRTAVAAVALAALYACTDEYHQSFVSSRYASVLDVGIDTLGAAAGMGGLWLVRFWKRDG